MKKSFAHGAMTLGAAGLLCSAVGSLFRIALAGCIGTSGIAYYQLAYPVYVLMTVIATTGIPAAISKRVSEFVALGDYRTAHYFFVTCFKTILLCGLIGTGVLAVCSSWIVKLQGVPKAWMTLAALSPAVFFMSGISAYRGYFQGLQNMTPTAISQMVEELVKAAVGLGLAYWMIQSGELMAAVGALAAIPLAELCTLLFLMIRYGRGKTALMRNVHTSPHVRVYPDKKAIRKDLWKLTAPITMAAATMSLVSLVDNFMVINLLKSSGFSQAIAESRFGLMTGYVSPIVYVPLAISSALQMSLVPSISASLKLKRFSECNEAAGVGLKLTTIFGLPCMCGMMLLGPLLLRLIFPGTLADPDHAAVTDLLMRVMAMTLFFLMVTQTCTGILQGMERQHVPAWNLLPGLISKVIVSAVLLKIPSLNVVGAALGTLSCFALLAVLDLWQAIRELRVRFSFYEIFGKPALAALGMTAVVILTMWALSSTPGWVLFILSTLVGIFTYAALVVGFHVVTPQDLRMLPGGTRLDYWLREKGIWR